ncbi:hypothetical protein [Nonomuraea jabiensis]
MSAPGGEDDFLYELQVEVEALEDGARPRDHVREEASTPCDSQGS